MVDSVGAGGGHSTVLTFAEATGPGRAELIWLTDEDDVDVWQSPSVALAIRPVPGSKTVSPSSVIPIAITVAPMIWLRAVIWLSTRPPSITETSQANAADAGCALAFLRHASEEQANERARGTGHRALAGIGRAPAWVVSLQARLDVGRPEGTAQNPTSLRS